MSRGGKIVLIVLGVIVVIIFVFAMSIKNMYNGFVQLDEGWDTAVSVSATRDSEGRVHLSLSNTDPGNGVDLACELRGMRVTEVTGRILTADDMTAHNTFDEPEAVCPVPFEKTTLDGETMTVVLPAKSVGFSQHFAILLLKHLTF